MRFSAIDDRAMARLRNTTRSSRKATAMMMAMASGALPVRAAVRSWFWAAGPPTRASGTWAPMVERSRPTMSEVAEASTAVAPMTRTTVRPLAAGWATIWASTTLGSALARSTTCWALPAGTVTYSGAAAPGPNDSTTMS